MQDNLTNGCIKKFIEEFECLKRLNGDPCRLNGSQVLKILKKNDFEKMLKQMKDCEDDREKFARIETVMLSVCTLNDYLDTLLSEFGREFEMPYIWLTLQEDTPLAGLVGHAALNVCAKSRIAFLSEDRLGEFFPSGFEPLIIGRYTAPYNSFFPPAHNYSIRSMAIIPLHLDGAVVGTLNFGHFVSNRFVPDMDMNRIQQIVAKLSLSLSRINAIERLKYLDCHDSLTGLLNRAALMKHLEKEFSRSVRHGKGMSVVCMDVDGLKRLNDTYGHEYGEMAIRYVAETIKSRIRTEDLAARIAGDEFVLVLPESKGKMSEFLVRRIQDHLDEHPFECQETRFCLSLNIGIASIDEDGILNPEQFLKLSYKRLNDTNPGLREPAPRSDMGSVFKFRAF